MEIWSVQAEMCYHDSNEVDRVHSKLPNSTNNRQLNSASIKNKSNTAQSDFLFN